MAAKRTLELPARLDLGTGNINQIEGHQIVELQADGRWSMEWSTYNGMMDETTFFKQRGDYRVVSADEVQLHTTYNENSMFSSRTGDCSIHWKILFSGGCWNKME